MISVDEALARIFAQIKPPAAETVPLLRAHRRVLAQPLTASHNQPPFDASAMDGYAVRAAEVLPGRPLKLAGTSQAGARFVGMMEKGQCVRIFTGAPLPIGADAVIMQEEATATGNQISFAKAPRPGQSIRRQGHDFQRGQELLPAGVALTPAMLNLAASANRPELPVTRRPRIAVLATGDELVPPGTLPGPDQIVASNSFGLIPLLSPYAERVIDLGIVADDRPALEKVLLDAFDQGIDVLVTTGGASVGDRDYVREVLVDLGVSLDFWKLAMRPGKPLMFGTRGKTLVFGLPGNPVSAMVTATVLLRPALRQMTGHSDPFWPQFGVALAAPLPANGPRRHFVRGTLSRNEIGFLQVTPIAETDSAHSSSLALADTLIIQTENDSGQNVGDIVDLILLSGVS
ncbi:gephyrin-like molybdotransferase Glp [Devosia sp.]|jgi:molybdopterin molybdotransferase|uniref:molybdopterin molybdotransferase MoeA n=1 Tax=Devosia sp. TaxID=1871048 RepID=UPI0037BE5B25